jgi:hypothetical protein
MRKSYEDFLLLRVFFAEDFFLGGTFAPARRACDSPIAIACLRLFTFLPDLPLFKVPRLRSCIACLTFLAAFLPYLAMIPPLDRQLYQQRNPRRERRARV